MRFTVKNVDSSTIRHLAREYLSSTYISLKSLGAKYGTTASTISNILWRGIAENIIDSVHAERICTKIIDKPSIGWYQRKLRWDEAFRERNNLIRKVEQDNKDNQRISELISLKEYYENAIASYDSYFIDEDEAPTLDSLKAKLEEVKRKIEQLA